MGHSVELVSPYWSIVGDNYPGAPSEVSPVDFRERVEAANKAGYRGIGFGHADIMSVSERLGFDTMKQILDDNGMTYVEVEMVMDWFTDGEKRRASDAVRADLLRAAEKLGAWHVKAGGEMNEDGGTDWPMEGMIRDFEMLCRQAADVGARVALELMPFTNLRRIDQGVDLWQGAGVTNGGLILDIWHMVRGGIDFDDIRRMPAGSISWIELNDAKAEIEGSLFNDTINCRELPGDGCFDIPGFVRAVLDAGYRGPFGVEIISRVHRALPIEEQARRGFDATRRQLEAMGMTVASGRQEAA